MRQTLPFMWERITKRGTPSLALTFSVAARKQTRKWLTTQDTMKQVATFSRQSKQPLRVTTTSLQMLGAKKRLQFMGAPKYVAPKRPRLKRDTAKA